MAQKRHAQRAQRIDLYNQGLSDKMIAKKLGIKQNSFADWRKRQGLTPNSMQCSCNMSRALTPGQCREMSLFLSDLLRIASMRPPGTKKNVIAFANEWRKIREERHESWR